MGSLRSDLIKELEARKSEGMRQSEMYSFLMYSRSHVSETLTSLETEGIIISRKEGKAHKRVWLTDYFPEHIEGLLRVGILRSSEYIPFLSSLVRTVLNKSIEIRVKPFNNAPDLISSLHEGTLDIGLAPTFTHILFSLTNRKEVLISSVASGGSSVLADHKVENNVLATSEASTMALISRELVKKKGTTIHFFGDPAEARDSFLQGSFRYLAIWEPYLSDILKHKEINRLEEDKNDAFRNPCCSAGVSRQFLTAHNELAALIADDYGSFIGSMEEKELEYGIKVISDVTGYGREQLIASLRSYDFTGRLNSDILRTYMINVGIPLSVERLNEMLME